MPDFYYALQEYAWIQFHNYGVTGSGAYLILDPTELCKVMNNAALGNPTELMGNIERMLANGYVKQSFWAMCGNGHKLSEHLSEEQAEDGLARPCKICKYSPVGDRYVKCVYILNVWFLGEDDNHPWDATLSEWEDF